MLSNPKLKQPTFSKIREGIENGDFLFLKVIKKFSTFLPKIATGVLFAYYDIVSKEKKKDLVHSKSEWQNFLHKIFVKKFIDQDSSKFTGGLDKGRLESVE